VDDEFWRDTVGKKNGIMFPCLGTTDSETILRVLETFFLKAPEKDFLQDHIDNLAFNVSGDYSLAILKEDAPDKIWFVRNSRPLDIAYCKKYNAIIFASTEMSIKTALKETSYVWDFFVSTDVPDGTIFNEIVDDSAVELTILPPAKNKRTSRFKFRSMPIEPCKTDYKYHKKMAEIRAQEDSEVTEVSEEQAEAEEELITEVAT
jgi:glucosamine 6-phosphate synthetase-like amidotransferase/phosphosugar isomerase protein